VQCFQAWSDLVELVVWCCTLTTGSLRFGKRRSTKLFTSSKPSEPDEPVVPLARLDVDGLVGAKGRIFTQLLEKFSEVQSSSTASKNRAAVHENRSEPCPIPVVGS
jgi:hypothetical protein